MGVQPAEIPEGWHRFLRVLYGSLEPEGVSRSLAEHLALLLATDGVVVEFSAFQRPFRRWARGA
jgi:hypothetical protein